MKYVKRMLVIVSLIALAGCGNSMNDTKTDVEASQRKMTTKEHENSKVLIAYFSRIGNIDSENKVDTTSSASVVLHGDDVFGNSEYMANLIQNVTGGHMHFIETSDKYPSAYDDSDQNALDIQAKKENEENIRPKLATHIDNIDSYDVIFLGFPTWYGNMPMAVYSFLDEYDLSDKKIFLFNTSGGSGPRNAYLEVSDMQPNAKVEKNILSVNHSQAAKLTNEDIEHWLSKIDYEN